MGIKVNFSDVDAGFEPLPAGTYHVKVTDGEIKQAGENAKFPGSEMILWTLTVQNGQYENRKLFYNTTLLPHALFGLKGLLAASGLYTKEQLDSEAFEVEIDNVIGSDLIAVVTVGTYQGEPTNNIRRVKSFSEDALHSASGGSDLMP